MAAPETALIKTWARIDGTEFDTILPMMIASATALVIQETGVDYLTVAMPESVQQWCAAIVAHWINNPDAASDKTLVPSPFLGGLLDPYRQFGMETLVV